MIMAEFINTIDVLGDEAVMDSIIECTITEFNDDNITFIGPGKFEYCSQLEAICVPNVTTIDHSAFRNCTSLKYITADTFPKVTKCNQGGSSTEAFAHCTSLETIVWPSLEQGAYFYKCTALRSVDMPNLTKNATFSGCKLLSEVNLPNLSIVGGSAFQDCTSLKYLTLPSVTECSGGSFFRAGPSIIDLPICTKMSGSYGVAYTGTFKALILRSSTVCVLDSTSMFNNNTPLENGTGHIYVPRALVDSYKAATNWSKYATSFRTLEDYTVDGTTTGAIREHCESITLDATELTFTDANSQTLTAIYKLGIYDSDNIIWTSSDNKVARVRHGVVAPVGDGTATITVTSGDCSATCAVTVNAGLVGPTYDIILTPYNGSEEGELPFYKLNVTAGQVLTLQYLLTKQQGYIYDGRNCGMNYYGSVSGSTYPMPSDEVGVDTIKEITIVSDGTITFSGFRNDTVANGELSTTALDRVYGKYLYVTIN